MFFSEKSLFSKNGLVNAEKYFLFAAEEKRIEHQPKAFHGSIRTIDLPSKPLANPNFRYDLIQLFEKLSYLIRFIVINL